MIFAIIWGISNTIRPIIRAITSGNYKVKRYIKWHNSALALIATFSSLLLANVAEKVSLDYIFIGGFFFYSCVIQMRGFIDNEWLTWWNGLKVRDAYRNTGGRLYECMDTMVGIPTWYYVFTWSYFYATCYIASYVTVWKCFRKRTSEISQNIYMPFTSF